MEVIVRTVETAERVVGAVRYPRRADSGLRLLVSKPVAVRQAARSARAPDPVAEGRTVRDVEVVEVADCEELSVRL